MANTDSSTPASEQPRRSRGWWLLGLVLIVVAIAALVMSLGHNKLHVGEKVYAEAAGHKIYKKEIQSIETAGGMKTKVTDHQAATLLADKYLLQAMAKEQGVTVTQADIIAAYGPKVSLQRSTNPYGYQNLVNQLYMTMLDNNNQGIYTGKYLIANLSRYVPYDSPLLPELKAANPKLGDPAAIAQDKQYAQTFITKLYDQIKAKKITFDQAIQMEHNDPVVGEKVYPTQPHSGPFDGTLQETSVLAARSIKAKIKSMKAGQLSEPFVVRTSNSSTDRNSTAESYFLVVQMDSIAGNKSDKPFQQELAQAKKHFGYKVNV